MRATTVFPHTTHVEPCMRTTNFDQFVVPTHLIYENHPDDARFSEVGSFGRLHPDLRDLVRADQPVNVITILSKAAIHLYNALYGRRGPIPKPFFAFACADLAVTGRRAYFGGREGRDTPLNSVRDIPALTRTLTDSIRAEFLDASATNARNCANQIVSRVLKVAWCLQGPPEARAFFRESLGWIAVSGEDDSPHRPVNAPCTPFPQYNIEVVIPAGTIMGGAAPVREARISTRFVVATARPAPRTFPTEPTALPPVAAPSVPPRVGTARDVILFIHGHSSRAEEFEDIAPIVLGRAESSGRQLVFISLDLPCAGYTEMFDSQTIIGSLDLSRNPDVSRPSRSFPGLNFFEEFICRFIETLGIGHRILAIIGGSLGGNMTLRLGRTREDRRSAYIPNLISWSAASVWDSFMEPRDPIDELAKRLALDTAFNSLLDTQRESQTPAHNDRARADYFDNVFIKVPLDLIVWAVKRQPEQWYRDNWQPCKNFHIENAMLDRQEIYCRQFRQMHWRIALEQLIFSQNLREEGRPLYERNRSNMLLLAGEGDNYDFTKIHDATRTLALRMVGTPGECLLLNDTGHSIHNERPTWFSDRILRFLGII